MGARNRETAADDGSVLAGIAAAACEVLVEAGGALRRRPPMSK